MFYLVFLRKMYQVVFPLLFERLFLLFFYLLNKNILNGYRRIIYIFIYIILLHLSLFLSLSLSLSLYIYIYIYIGLAEVDSAGCGRTGALVVCTMCCPIEEWTIHRNK